MNVPAHCPHLLFAAVLVTVTATANSSRAEPDPSVPGCIAWSTSTRYRGIGYDHLVQLRSKCEQPADCQVSTNVNPEPQRAEVPAGGEVEVVTFMASPSSEFRARVACVLRPK